MELYFRLSLTYYHIIRHQTVLEEAMTPLEITLIILLATLVAFMTGKIPFSVIASGIILALIMTGVMTPAEAFSGFINTNVVMFVAMFVTRVRPQSKQVKSGLKSPPLYKKW